MTERVIIIYLKKIYTIIHVDTININANKYCFTNSRTNGIEFEYVRIPGTYRKNNDTSL